MRNDIKLEDLLKPTTVLFGTWCKMAIPLMWEAAGKNKTAQRAPADHVADEEKILRQHTCRIFNNPQVILKI